MDTNLTRRQFLTAVSAGATYLALTNTVGCDSRERTPKAKTPKRSPLPTPKVSPLPKTPSAPLKGIWAFRSRPDLSPPAVEVTAQANDDTTPGYIFVAPKKGGGQYGPMILDDRGQPVWFRPVQDNDEYAMDFKVQRYRGEPVLTWWEGEPLPLPSVGEHVILDSSYREITRVQPGNGYQGDHHDFLITSQDTALFAVYNPVRRNLSSIGGPKDGVVLEGIIQEVDIETGEVLFEWHSLEHVSPNESYLKPKYRKYFDYFHLNTIDVDHDNNLIITARNTFAVYKIDRKSGEIIWRLGGKNSDFKMGPGTRTAWQHDARRQPDGTITIFDNGAVPQVHEQSRGIVLDLDEENLTASLVREYTFPGTLLAGTQGNMQVLPTGNVFIGWGSEPFFSEFSHDGKLLLDAHFLTSDNESYRAFRFPWKEQPQDAPAVVAESEPDDRVTLYASWNGATDVASWEVLAGPSPGHLESVGSVPRDGFETAMLVQTSEPYVAVRAKNRLGQVLGSSAPVEL